MSLLALVFCFGIQPCAESGTSNLNGLIHYHSFDISGAGSGSAYLAEVKPRWICFVASTAVYLVTPAFCAPKLADRKLVLASNANETTRPLWLVHRALLI